MSKTTTNRKHWTFAFLESPSVNLRLSGATPKLNPIFVSAHAFPARWVTLRGCRRAVRRQDVARAQALGAEACRKPRWRIGVQATVGALSFSERVFFKKLWQTPSSPPWPGIGMFEAITTMKVGYRLMPDVIFSVPAGIPAYLASTSICEFLVSGARLEFRGGSVGENNRTSEFQRMTLFYIVISVFWDWVYLGRGRCPTASYGMDISRGWDPVAFMHVSVITSLFHCFLPGRVHICLL